MDTIYNPTGNVVAVTGNSGEADLTKALARFSPREVEVIRAMANGASDKDMAKALDIAVGTVKVMSKTIRSKLGFHNRTQVAMWAVANGIIPAPEAQSWTSVP